MADCPSSLVEFVSRLRSMAETYRRLASEDTNGLSAEYGRLADDVERTIREIQTHYG